MDAKYWLAQLDREQRAFKDWRDQAKKLVKRYRDDDRSGSATKLNIFWANTETLKPVAYGRLPEPVVRRRYLDADPVGLAAADLVQRGLAWTIDDNDAHREFEKQRDDMLIPGRGVVRIKYDASFSTYRPQPVYADGPMGEGGETGESGEMGEPTGYELDGERVEPDFDDEGPYVERKDKEAVYACYVHWDRFKHDPAPSWDEVKWVAFGELMSRSDLKRHFGKKKAASIDMTYTEGESDKPNCAMVWEIWSKSDKRRYWVAEDHDRVLDSQEDPLGLEGFFPCEEPAAAIITTDSLVPVPEFWVYQDQADELDVVVGRISKLVAAARVIGIYAGTHKEIIDIVRDLEDGQLKAIEDPAMYGQTGGLKNAISWLPIQEIVAAIVQLTQRELHLKQQIYEVSGISDIMRGSTRASETGAAQQLKAQFGAARTGPRAEPMRRSVKGLYRKMAEVMCRFFSPETWKRITGIEPAPEVLALLQSGDFEFRVDIETDATVAEDAAQKKQEATEFVTALVQLLQAAGTIVQGQPLTAQMMGELVKWTIRRYGTAKDLEKVIDDTMGQLMQQAQQPKPDPEAQKAQAEMQAMQMKGQIEQQKAQADIEGKRLDAQIKMQVAQQQMQIEQMKAQMEMLLAQQKGRNDIALERERTQADIQTDRARAQSDQQIAQQQAATQQQIARRQAAQRPQKAAA